ncbi:MAG: hypothetical protein D6690_10985 [Nitrospirae bacterium]|nr:MAG: hypothetical protein D6690_10985 [Nitrospirota bacterium]
MEIARWSSVIGILGLLLIGTGFLLPQILPQPSWLILLQQGLALVCLVTYFVLNYRDLTAFSARRSTRLGLSSIFSVVLAGGIAGIVNFLAAQHAPQWDFSETQNFTLTHQTYRILRELPRDVTITVFSYEQSPSYGAFRDLLATYEQESPKIHVAFVDPERQPDLARTYDIHRIDTAVLESGDQRVYVTKPTEAELTNAILRVTRDRKPVIRFVTGHGEPSLTDRERPGFARAKEVLTQQGYDVDAISLTDIAALPDDIAVLGIVDPITPFSAHEQAIVRRYLRRGGRLLLLLGPPTKTHMDPMLAEWGARLGAGIIVDERDRLGRASPTALLIRTFTTHAITKDFTAPVLLPVSRPIDHDPAARPDWEFSPLAHTSPESWAETDLSTAKPVFDPVTDRKGPFVVAAVLTPKSSAETSARPDSSPSASQSAESRTPAMVLVGNATFASNGYLNYPGNTDFFLHLVAWLAGEEELVSIAPKEPAFRPFMPNPEQEQVLLFFQVLFLPAMIIFLGFSIWRKRRRL